MIRSEAHPVALLLTLLRWAVVTPSAEAARGSGFDSGGSRADSDDCILDSLAVWQMFWMYLRRELTLT